MLKSSRSIKPRGGVRALLPAVSLMAMVCAGIPAHAAEQVGQSVRVINVVTG